MTRMPLAVLLLLLPTGCGPLIVDPGPPPPGTVNSTGTPTDVDLAQVAPDEIQKAIASSGINVSLTLAQDLPPLATLVNAYYDERTKRLPVAFKLLQLPAGFTYSRGWYAREGGTDRRLKVRFEDENGVPPAWDVLAPENYDPAIGQTFPGAVVRVRCELEASLGNGGRFAATLLSSLPRSGRGLLEPFGSGSLSAPPPLNAAGFEALNARMAEDGSVAEGDLVIKSLAGGRTVQYSGRYGGTGVLGEPYLTANGRRVANIKLQDGKWAIINGAGTFPL